MMRCNIGLPCLGRRGHEVFCATTVGMLSDVKSHDRVLTGS